MEDHQSFLQDNINFSLVQKKNKNKIEALNIDSIVKFENDVKIMDIKSKSLPTLSHLEKNTSFIPNKIVCIKDTDLNSFASSSSSTSTKEIIRNKIALAPGHSLMDWIRLNSSEKDLSGVDGQFLVITSTELAKHNKENDAWIAIRGIVFNISLYMSFHPGGVSELMKGVGQDATKLFDEVHAWVNYQSILRKCVIGRLENSINSEYYFERIVKNSSTLLLDNMKDCKNITMENHVNSPAINIICHQTKSTISFHITPINNLSNAFEIKKLDNFEILIRINYGQTEDIKTYKVKLSKDIQWPPKLQRISDLETEIICAKKDKEIWKKHRITLLDVEKKDINKRIYNTYEVVENNQLCKIIHLLILRAKNFIQIIPPGRHVEVQLNTLGTKISRCYTPVPYHLHPDEHYNHCYDDCICFIVKHYKNGIMTPCLTALQPGHMLELSNVLGDFHLEIYEDYTTMHLIAGGTGLTIMLSVIKNTLLRYNKPLINLVIFNTSEENIFYATQLDHLSKEYKFKVSHVLSAATTTWTGKTGVASKKLLEDLVGKYSKNACIFSCGPVGFMKIIRESLLNLGWETSQLYEFKD